MFALYHDGKGAEGPAKGPKCWSKPQSLWRPHDQSPCLLKPQFRLSTCNLGIFQSICHLETVDQHEAKKAKAFEQKMEKDVFHATIKTPERAGRGEARELRPGVGNLTLGFEAGKLVFFAAGAVQAAEALEAGAGQGSSAPPPCPPAWMTIRHVRPLRKRRASAPHGCQRPTCQSPSCHKYHSPRKTVLGKFNTPPQPDSFEGITKQGRADVTPLFLSKKLVWEEQRRSSS